MTLIQQLSAYHKDPVPAYKPRDPVWILRDRNVQEVDIFALVYRLCGSGKDGQVFILTGYELDDPSLNGKEFRPHELYASKEDAERDAAWHPVDGFSGEEWDAAVGNLEQINAFNKAFGSGEEIEDLPPNEFMACFGTFAERDPIEELLHQCRSEGGLMERDRCALQKMVSVSCDCCKPRWQDYPLLNRIFTTLHIDGRLSSVSGDDARHA